MSPSPSKAYHRLAAWRSAVVSLLFVVALCSGAGALAQSTTPSAADLTLDLPGPSFKSADLLATPMRVTAAAAGAVTVRLYDQVAPDKGRVLLQTSTVQHPGGGTAVNIPFDEAYRGKGIYATAEQAGTGASDQSAFATDTKAFVHPRAEPADFDAFWDGKKAELAAVAPEWVETRLPDFDTPYSTAYKVTGAIGGGRMVTMWVAIPKAGPNSPADLTPDTKFPAMIVFPAAGNTNNRYFQTPFTAAERVGAISVSVNLHEDIVTGSDGTGSGGSYVQQGVADRETNYFLNGIKRCLRAVDYVRQHPRFDGGDVMAFGESQGGGLAKTVAGLYPDDITLVMSQHDALSAHGARAAGEPEGWPQWVVTFGSTYDEVAYYDAVFHARRIEARAMFSNTGFLDAVVPPSAALMSFNEFEVHGATKVVLLSENRAHTSTPAYGLGYLDFARANLIGATAPAPPSGTPAYEDREVSIARDGNEVSATYSRGGGTQDLSTGIGRWVQISGPGTITFASPTAARTSFTVSAGPVEAYKIGFEIEEFPAYSEYYVTTGYFAFGVGNVLPATLTSFTAEAFPDTSGGSGIGRALLEWETASERDNVAFEIERSPDAATWTTIGEVAGAGTTTPTAYAFTDEAPLAGANYYRLRQRDSDGAESLSEVVVVYFDTSSATDVTALAGVRAFPNPARDYLDVVGLPEGGAEVVLLDVAGRAVAVSPQGAKRMDLGGVPAGAYVLRVKSEAGGAVRRVVVR